VWRFNQCILNDSESIEFTGESDTNIGRLAANVELDLNIEIIQCSRCLVTNPVSFAFSLVSKALYPKHLETRNYFELSDDLCQLLNQDWTVSPQIMLRHSCYTTKPTEW
jgi:uncharacterized metal-binding protein YceD (DUF177 family)